MATEAEVFAPLPIAETDCAVCRKIDANLTLKTLDERGGMVRELQVLAEDIRKTEERLSENKPLLVHQDCLKISKISHLSALSGLRLNR